ncbi:hypothetical protein I302_105432 [Kwoniella bestiolae CBS 10118]|uniref:Uncharacterized protein n=1 Tax=Kwoniella bestiolae CBS 10118 TaxID=1296100 RepID=A0A1B9FT32_9TREE|nr:hypothetical protein I302_08713 [Kwoniella bestiolae CBS 10118]OCF21934.1 hypothetical protein I302_08713 [Kwoniella bestiolae CBS 10118]
MNRRNYTPCATETSKPKTRTNSTIPSAVSEPFDAAHERFIDSDDDTIPTRQTTKRRKISKTGWIFSIPVASDFAGPLTKVSNIVACKGKGNGEVRTEYIVSTGMNGTIEIRPSPHDEDEASKEILGKPS